MLFRSITPWNFPIAIPSWKIAPALVCGNTVVFKPARDTPLLGQRFVEIFAEAGLPAGVLNIVHGGGESVGDALVKHPDVPLISLTGSREVGIKTAENGAAYPDAVEVDSRVRDQGRQTYLARHVAAAADALRAGVPLTGYYVWSLLDNYEWSYGYTRRFGLVHVDFASQRRTPKDSARWFQRLIARV